MQSPFPGMAVMAPGQDPRRGTGFLEESPGNSSAMRLMCMMALVTAIVLSVFIVATPPIKSTDEKGRTSLTYPARDPQTVYLIFGFLLAAFAPKAIQKFAENKLPTYEPTLQMGQPTTVMLPQMPPPMVLPAGFTMPAAQNGQQQTFLAQPSNNNQMMPPVVTNGHVTSPPTLNDRIQFLKQRGGL